MRAGLSGRRQLALALLTAIVLVLLAGVAPAATGPAPVSVSVVQTAAAVHRRLTELASLRFSAHAPPKGVPVISVDDGIHYQRISGFGAAMTDSSAWLIERQVAPAARRALMDRLFGAGGLRLGFLRVPIGASDYTVGGRPYSYDDLPPHRSDPALRHFSIAHDRAYILPALRQARALNPGLELLATPWSPPAWMKANDSLSNVANRGTLLGADYGPWAQYIVRFLQAYAQAGAPIAALTPQNEPGNPTRYPGLNLSAGAEAAWLRQDLVPALAAAGLHPELYGLDAGWASTAFAQQTLSGPAATELSGLSWHCYYGSPGVMSALRSRRPALDTIVDECSPGISVIPSSEVVISSLRNWASAVALWNLALDPKGGPVQQPNTGCPGCYGLVTIDGPRGSVTLNTPFFQIGQASEFIEPDAVRVASTTEVRYDYTRPGVDFVSTGVDDVAVRNPDGSRVLLTYNNSNRPATFAVRWAGESFEATVPAQATTTFRWAPRVPGAQ